MRQGQGACKCDLPLGGNTIADGSELWFCRRWGCNHVDIIQAWGTLGRDTLTLVSGPILRGSSSSEKKCERRELQLTLWVCSGEQYQALWQRLHHINVG